jgi:hypothetical protein
MTAAWPDEPKLAGLRSKLSSLDTEFRHWRAESETAKPLRKHNTQIRRVTLPLDALRLQIGGRLDDLVAAPDGQADRIEEIERMILDVHRIWEFFRSKLSQRYVEWFRQFLVATDQFVWDCYTPVRAAVDPAHVARDDVREPPMVFLNGGWSPFELSRGLEYEAEFVPEEEFPKQRYRAILDDLPFPVIGVPWYQVRHLPDAVLLGHEVGHTIEDDFKLTDRLEALLAQGLDEGKVKGAHRAAWSAWLGEMFADLYGTLAAGPAFVGALIDLVAGPPKRIASELAKGPDWGVYPPAALRVHVALTALDDTGYPTESGKLRDRWTGMFPAHANQAYEDDARPIVHALVHTPITELGGSPLVDILSFTPVATIATQSSDRMLKDYDPQSTDARALLAAARFAFETSPTRYVERGVEARVLRVIDKAQDDAFRNTPGGASGAAAPPPAGGLAAPGAATPSARDADLGGRLFDRLATLRSA